MLIVRFREREENVRCDVFNAYRALLRITKPAVVSFNESKLTGLPPSAEATAAVQALDTQIPQLVKILGIFCVYNGIHSRYLDCIIFINPCR